MQNDATGRGIIFHTRQTHFWKLNFVDIVYVFDVYDDPWAPRDPMSPLGPMGPGGHGGEWLWLWLEIAGYMAQNLGTISEEMSPIDRHEKLIYRA